MKRTRLRFLTVAVACLAGTSIPAVAQTITALNPPAQTAQAPNSFTLVATGTNFCTTGGAVLNFNGTPHAAAVNGAGTTATSTIAATEVVSMGIVPVTVTNAAGVGCSVIGTSPSFNFTINPPLVLTPSSLPGGSVGSPYNQTLTASGGTPPYSTVNPTGEVVPPFTTNPGTMTINFTPASANFYDFSAGLTDSGGGSITPSYNFSIDTPSTVTASQGSGQAATVGTAFGTVLQASVLDVSGFPVQGAQVTFTPPGSGPTGSFSGSNVVFTNASGVATAPVFTAGTVAGAYSVTASVPGTSSTATYSLTNVAGAASSVTALAGTPQATAVNTQFPTQFQARVTDAFGNPVFRANVTFAAPGSGASGTFANSPIVPTNAAGVAAAPAFTANTIAGSYIVTATATGVPTPANFNLTNNAGAPTSITATQGTPQFTTVGTVFPTTLQAIVRDSFNNPTPGVNVTFAVPVGGASGSFSGSATVTTTGGGLAIAPAFTANSTAGSYSVTATVATLPPAVFNLTNNPGAPASITMSSGGGQSTPVGTQFESSFQALVRDANNNPVQGVNVTFVAPGSGPSGTFISGTTVATGPTGIATSPALNANTKAGMYNVTATATGVPGSAVFSLTNTPSFPSSINATAGTPQSTAINTAFATALQATVTDQYGNGIPNILVNFNAPVGQLPIPSGTFGSSSSTSVNTNAAGVAIAPTFVANGLSGSYMVSAGSSSVDAPATNFNLTNTGGAPTSISVFAGSGQSATVGAAFTTPLQAIVKDANNTPVPNVAVIFAAPASGAGGTFGGSTTVQTNSSGVATAPTLTANTTAGAFTATASTNGVGTPASFSLTNNPGAPGSITSTSGTPQNTIVNTAFSTPLQATVKDASGNVVPNVQVTFAVPGSGASGVFGGPATVATNASGVATAPSLTANSTAGAFTATAAAAGIATPANFSLTNNAGAPATISATVGNPESAAIGTLYAPSLQATVKDASGNVVPNVQVTFSVPASGASGTFATVPAIVNTNRNGIATAPALTANSTAGAFTATAATSGVATPANFSLTNLAGPPASITSTGGTPQSAAVGVLYAAPLQATVKDANGNPAPNVPVTFTLPTFGQTATFTGGQPTATVQTNANGVATSPALTAGTFSGGFNATATTPGVAAPALFTLDNTTNVTGTTPPPPPPLSITTSTLPNAVAGTPYSAGIAATGGVPPYSFSPGTPAPGLLLSASGAIGGTPTTAGTQTFSVQVTDSTGAGASKTLTLVVTSNLIITTSSLPTANLGQSYSVSFSATGGQPGYFWSISGSGGVSPSDDSSKDRIAASGLPPGLTFTSSSTSATLSGTPTALGSFSFSVSVTDTGQNSASKSFSLTVQPSTGAPGVQVSQSALTFQGPQGGNQPPPQYLSIVANNGQPLLATIALDGGAPGTPAPPWLKARFVSAITPARLAVQTIPTGLPAGTYTGRVLVNYQGQQTIVVNVSFTIDLTPPSLAVAPGFLRFTAFAGVTTSVQQPLLVSNLGSGGPLSFTASVVSGSPWLTVTPAAGATMVGGGVPLQVTVNAQTLKVGSYLGKIRIAGPIGGSVDVPVSLFVSQAGPLMSINPGGVQFNSRAGNGQAIPLPVTVLNSGTGMVNWAADLVAGQSWLSLSPVAGQSTPTVSSQLTATANPTGLNVGPYYGLIRFTDPQSLNSPQYALAVLNVEAATTSLDASLAPGGLFFTAAPGGAKPGPQALQVFVSSDTPAAFQAAASSDDGGTWLSIGQQTATASTHAPGQITVSVNPAGLKPGVYTGDVSVSFSSEIIRTANITLVVLSTGGTSTSSTGDTRRATCAPSQLSLTSTSLVNAFASPAGWPTPLIVRATDDCGNGASGAQVVASFSNGDPPLSLSRTDPNLALFSGTWAPKNAAPQMTITITGLAQGLSAATAQLTGAVGGNAAPALSPNGTVNVLNPALGAAVAPGTVAQVNGSSLATSASVPGSPPLQTQFNGASVLIGAFLAPLYSLSGGQVDIQIPTELTPNRQYSILVSSGAAFTLPDTLTTTDVSPGLLYVAEHSDLSLVSPASPAQVGETILLYLVGMGATNPPVASGIAAPTPSAAVTNTPTVTFNGQNATVTSAGLTPGSVGLYQVSVQVPAGTPSGDATVTVTQNGTPSNTVIIPIQ